MDGDGFGDLVRLQFGTFGVGVCLHIKGKLQIGLAVLLNTAMTFNVTCILMSQGLNRNSALHARATSISEMTLRLAKANMTRGGHSKACGWRFSATGLSRINSAKTPSPQQHA